jgi:hypothetical protein
VEIAPRFVFDDSTPTPPSRSVPRTRLVNEAAVRVESVEPGRPAHRAALQPGDRVDDLHRVLTADLIGVTVEISVLRGAQRLELRIEPAEAS